jgi:glyoxylate/hydroxypyruvate reductase
VGSLRPTIPFLARTNAQGEALWLEALRAAMPQIDIVLFKDLSQNQKQNAKFAIVANPDPLDIAALPNLVWIQSLWAGVEELVKDLLDSAIKIVRLVDPELSNTMAQAVLSWVLYLYRQMPAYAHQQTQRIWHQLPLAPASQTQIGILGLGQLGKASALQLRDNGFQVSGWSRTSTQIDGVSTLSGDEGLEALLSQVDILVVLLPLTTQTMGLLDSVRLSQLKTGASLINFARGAIVNTSDLLAKLDQGHVAHAVLDVFETEPLTVGDPLWLHPRITILPHISAPTNKITASQIVANNVSYFFESGEVPVSVDLNSGY